MNTTKIAASTNDILAIDLGKYKSVVCILGQASGEYRFARFDMTRAKFEEPSCELTRRSAKTGDGLARMPVTHGRPILTLHKRRSPDARGLETNKATRR